MLRIPVPAANNFGSDYKILPDSAFVYGPGSVGFNLDAFIQAYGGYLAHYTEEMSRRITWMARAGAPPDRRPGHPDRGPELFA